MAEPQADRQDARKRDPLHLAAPTGEDVEARRARAAIEGRLFAKTPAARVTVGRYQVVSRIGVGGMGVVYRAHDPELARDVAVKLLAFESLSEEENRTARARLVREARAMARLAHPNVIHVYDVGTVEDGVFIAMELVEGQSLAAWLAAQARDWLEVLRVCLDAGRGLVAAHAAGVIHRDFKPENVLVGADGRVRVGDFGLAGAPAATGAFAWASQGDMSAAEAATSQDDGRVHTPLTRTGALLGTPKYMAPEQQAGAPASARSDQFSFCVTLYEALYGRPPYEGDTVTRYRKNVRLGHVLPAPVESKVRPWVHAEIVRGLTVDPAARHPGMEGLLERLEQALVDPRLARRGRRRAALVAVALLGAAATGAAAAMIGREDPAPQVALVGEEQAPEAGMERASMPVEPVISDTSPRGTEASPVPTKERPNAAPDAKAEGKSPPGRRGHCYFEEDSWDLVAQRERPLNKAEPWVRDTVSGECYHCGVRLGEERRKGLNPNNCSRNYSCRKESADKCPS